LESCFKGISGGYMSVTNDFFNRLEGVWQNKLNGEWQDEFGWSVTSQPVVGQAGPSDFNIRIDQMRETIVFKHIGTPRNIGVTGETGHWHAMSYQINIETPEGEGIHHEMGHFLLNVLEPTDEFPRGETPEPFRGHIIRQASIPRANSILTSGILRPGSVADAATVATPFYNARPKSLEENFQAFIDAAFNPKNVTVQGNGGPDLTKPLQWLTTIEPDDGTDIDWVFAFRVDEEPSQMASGHRVAGSVGLGNLLSDFWIGRRTHGEEDRHILQYAQKVDLLFNDMPWPHIAVNTLIKQVE
jgi:hypothetical protein